MTDRRLELVALDDLEGALRNPKRHATKALRGSIDRFGYVEPVVVDERTGRLVAGHGRLDDLRARKAAGEAPPAGVDSEGDAWLVPVLRGWSSRSDAEAEAYLVASNRIGEMGGWDPTMLSELLGDLDRSGEMGATGYDADDLRRLEAEVALAGRDAPRDPDDVPAVPAKPRTNPGDIWAIGPHRVGCGSSTDAEFVARVCGGPVDLLFTSPPYNVDVAYTSSADDYKDWAGYGGFLGAVLEACLPQLGPGRAVCWNIGTAPDTHPGRQQVLLEDAGLTYLRTMVWRKVGVPVPLAHFQEADPRARHFTPNYTHELVYVFARSDDGSAQTEADALAAWPSPRPLTPAERHELVVVYAKGRKLRRGQPTALDELLTSDVFELHQSAATRDLATKAGVERTGAQSGLETRARKTHPAPFPVRLPEAFITHFVDLGELVLDPFAGAGTTMLAAARIGRRGAGVDVDPGYCDVAVERLVAETGVDAELV